jgi:hypothetical protein
MIENKQDKKPVFFRRRAMQIYNNIACAMQIYNNITIQEYRLQHAT